MRILFFLGALAVLGLVVTGAIKLQRSNNTISIHIDKKQVAEETKEFIEDTKEVIEDIREAFDDEEEEEPSWRR